jgi:hypothetical protein
MMGDDCNVAGALKIDESSSRRLSSGTSFLLVPIFDSLKVDAAFLKRGPRPWGCDEAALSMSGCGNLEAET